MKSSRWVFIPFMATVLLLAGCSSSSSGTSSSGAGSGGTEVIGDPIVIGGICSCSGIGAPANGLSKAVGSAWASYINHHGGINGHPVKFIIEDDASTPATGLQAARKLVEQEKVIAIVGENSLSDDAWGPYVQSKGVPVVGGQAANAQFLSNPNFYASGAQLPVQKIGEFASLTKDGVKKYSQLYCAEAPVCAQFTKLSQLASAITGSAVSVSGSAVSATATNYISQCQSMKSSGTEAISIGATSATVVRIAADCTQLGFKPQFIGEAPSSSPTFLNAPGLEGMLLTSPNGNSFDESIPGVKTMNEALDTYSPGTRSSRNYAYNSLNPWFGGQLFAAAAKAGNLGPTSTAADVKTGLYALKDETLEGLSPPLTYTKDQPTLITCYFVMQIKGGKFTSPQGTQHQCLTDAQKQGLISALQNSAK